MAEQRQLTGHQESGQGGTHYKTYRCGVIGTGEEGSALVRKLVEHGCDVKMAHEKPVEHLAELCKETGAKAVDIVDVAKDVDIVFLCIPLKAIPDLPPGLLSKCPPDTIVVDCCNYYPHRDGPIPEIDEQGIPESIWVRNQISRDVVKAFNSVLAKALLEAGRPKGSEDRIAIPICGDNQQAKQKIAQLVEEFGFDAYDVPGGLGQSWRQQPGSPAYGTNLNLKALELAIREAKKEKLAKTREASYKEMRSSETKMDWKSLVAMLRKVSFTEHEVEVKPVATT